MATGSYWPERLKAAGCVGWTLYTDPPKLFEQYGSVECECKCGLKVGASTSVWGDPWSRMGMMDKLWKRMLDEHVKLNPVLSLMDLD